jgi:hypothetical protein
LFVLWLQRIKVSKRVFSFFLSERLTNSTPGDNEVEIPCNNNAIREESKVRENISVWEKFEDEILPAVFETTVKLEAGFSHFYSF